MIDVMRVIDGGLIVFLDLSRLFFPTYSVLDASVGNDLSLGCAVDSFDVEMLPWSVEHQGSRYLQGILDSWSGCGRCPCCHRGQRCTGSATA
jgi:hypothetical protein